MSYEKKFPDWEQRVITASKNNPTGASAAASLGIKYDTYKKYAIKYGCFVTNQGSKGISRDKSMYAIPLEEILEGSHPQYQTNKLKRRLLGKGILKEECDICGLSEWLGKEITLHLDHIDGNAKNHILNNLRLLCPNCHSQTDTWCGRNKGINN